MSRNKKGIARSEKKAEPAISEPAFSLLKIFVNYFQNILLNPIDPKRPEAKRSMVEISFDEQRRAENAFGRVKRKE